MSRHPKACNCARRTPIASRFRLVGRFTTNAPGQKRKRKRASKAKKKAAEAPPEAVEQEPELTKVEAAAPIESVPEVEPVADIRHDEPTIQLPVIDVSIPPPDDPAPSDVPVNADHVAEAMAAADDPRHLQVVTGEADTVAPAQPPDPEADNVPVATVADPEPACHRSRRHR